MKQIKVLLTFIVMGGLLFIMGCGDDEPGAAGALTITAVSATGTNLAGASSTVDLNGATAGQDVPLMPTITATFSKDVNASTVNSGSVSISDGTSTVGASFATAGAVVTMTLTEELVRGTDYTISLTSAIAATDGGTLAATSRAFKTEGRQPVVVPQESAQVLHLSFDGSLADASGSNKTVLVDEVSYTNDRFGFASSAGDFNGTSNYGAIEYSADFNTASNTISYWIQLPSDYDAHVRKHFALATFSIGGAKGIFHEYGRFDNDGSSIGIIDFLKAATSHENTGTNGGFDVRFDENKQEGRGADGERTFEADNFPWLNENLEKWMHVVVTYDVSTTKKSFYINGVLGTEFTYLPSDDGGRVTGGISFDLDGADTETQNIDAVDVLNNNRNLYVGAGLPFWGILQSDGFSILPSRDYGTKAPHAFKGQMDDFRWFNVALTEAEVVALYDSEKP